MTTRLPKTLPLQLVHIPVNSLELEGELALPANATGLVVFAHGSGSSRHSPRNMLVADTLRQHSLATLLVDLLSAAEDKDYQNRFDIVLLAERLAAITDWATHDTRTRQLAIGYFGASTGAAAAFIAAAGAEDTIKAIVSRGGRVDLAYDTATAVQSPTLLIVGEKDYGVREVNEAVFRKLRCQKELAVVPTATHLFEEPGTLEEVARLAGDWFKTYLGG